MLGLVAAEAILRFIHPLEARRERYFDSIFFYQYNPKWVRHDSELGFSNIPNIQARIVRPDIGGFAFDVRINSEGFRDDEASLSNPDLLVLGDSFGFGWGVGQNETCEARLEKETGRSALNMGVSGYGTLQQYLQLRHWAEVLDLRGKTAVVLFYPNDWLEITGSVADVYPALAETARTTEVLTTSPISKEDFEKMLREANSSRLRGLGLRSEIARRLWKARQNLRPRALKRPFLPDYAPLMKPPHLPPPPMRAAVDRIVAAMADLARRRGFRLVFAYVPPLFLYEGERCEDADALKEILDQHGVDLVDLRPVLGKEDYWPLDRHWKPSGHRKAAAAIAERL